MKITSQYRGNKVVICNEPAALTLKDGELKIRQKRHYNGNEKFYEIDFDRADTNRLITLIEITSKPKSKLVKLAEKIDRLIVTVARTLKQRRG